LTLIPPPPPQQPFLSKYWQVHFLCFGEFGSLHKVENKQFWSKDINMVLDIK